MAAAKITVEHTVTIVPPGEAEIRLYKHRPMVFCRAMDSLYPELVNGAGTRAGDCWMAFRPDGTFIGLSMGKSLASTRKNPWFAEDGDWFFKAHLATLHVNNVTTRVSRCKPINYGTLRFWKRLGLGAEIGGHGDPVCCDLSFASLAELDRMITKARPDYQDIRAAVRKHRLPQLDPAVVLPQEPSSGAIHVQVRLT